MLKEGMLADTTQEKSEAILKKFKEKFGSWRIKAIRGKDIKDFLDAYEISRNSKVNVRSNLNMFFDYCWLDTNPQVIPASPMNELRFKRQSMTQAELDKIKDKCLFSDEFKKLKELMITDEKEERSYLVRRNKHRYRLFVEFCYLNGTRYGEAAGSTWSHANQGGFILIHKLIGENL